jgi:hypothetical protein
MYPLKLNIIHSEVLYEALSSVMKPSYVLSHINMIAQEEFTAFSHPGSVKSYALVSMFGNQYDSRMKIQACVRTSIVRNKALKICTHLDLKKYTFFYIMAPLSD